MSSLLRGLVCAAVAAWAAHGSPAGAREILRVCSDPNNLPFSHKDETGLENRLAKLWAEKLGVPLEYTWFPQRLGFLRNTLQAPAVSRDGYLCDVVMGVAATADNLLTTKAYYRSTYALVYPAEGKLKGTDSGTALARLPPDQKLALRIGAFNPTPAVDWLARHGMTNQTLAYPIMSGDPSAYPGQLVDQVLARAEVDAVMLWGPIAGFFAGRVPNQKLTLIPMVSESGIQFDFAIAAGVRFPDQDGKAELDGLIDDTRSEIDALLAEFHFPVLPIAD